MSGKRQRLLGRMDAQRETSWRPASIYERHGLPLSAESLRATSERLVAEAEERDGETSTDEDADN